MWRICLAFLVFLASVGVGRAADTVDCSGRFPVGVFALTEQQAAPLIGQLRGFSLVYILKKLLPMKASGAEDPCELVYGVDVFEFAAAKTPGTLVAGCTGDFRGNGARDYVVLLRRNVDGRYVPHVFLARARTFDIVELEPHATDDSAWFGPFCPAKPRREIFQGPDFEGNGEGVRVPVVGDLITVAWWTYYWRPALKQFDSILTTD